MTREQLQALISSGENEQLEFKETTGQRGDACQALCAFLNADGGTVVFGVSRKGILTGQLVSDSTKRDLFEVFAKFEPSVAVATEWVRVDETHVAIVCHVDAGARKPYLYDGRPYRRLQSPTAVMPQSDYEAMLYDRPNLVKDWSSEVVPYATFDDLDDHAIQVAREGFIEKHSRRFSAAEVNGWDKKTFLDRARLTLNGCITRTTMLLVGKELSAHLLTPNPATGGRGAGERGVLSAVPVVDVGSVFTYSQCAGSDSSRRHAVAARGSEIQGSERLGGPA